MEQATIGIDPGAKGAMALTTLGGEAFAIDWKTPQAMGDVLHDWMGRYHIVLVALEKVNAMPSKTAGGKRQRMGATSAFSFGRNAGIWNGLLIGARLPFIEVTPQTWQKGLVGKKAVDGVKPSVAVAMRLYPRCSLYGPQGGLKDGRADALCMAHWARAQAGMAIVSPPEEADW